MWLTVNLVVCLLMLTSFINVNSQLHQHISGKRKINRFLSTKLPIGTAEENHESITSVIKNAAATPRPQSNSTSIFSKMLDFPSALEILEPEEEWRDGPIKKRVKKKKWHNALMALLLAYKLKFAALVPMMIGGVILLLSTTAMAGFFFALFAAILGLKGS